MISVEMSEWHVIHRDVPKISLKIVTEALVEQLRTSLDYLASQHVCLGTLRRTYILATRYGDAIVTSYISVPNKPFHLSIASYIRFLHNSAHALGQPSSLPAVCCFPTSHQLIFRSRAVLECSCPSHVLAPSRSEASTFPT